MSAGTREGATLVDHQGQVVELRHRVTDLAAKVAEAEAREVIRVAHLEEILDIAHEHGGEDGGDGGVTCGACRRILALADSALALSSPSPSAQALTRVVEAVGRTVEAFERESSKEEHAALAKEVTAAYRALQAARSGRGEERSPFWSSVEELADSVQEIPPERREMSGVRNTARTGRGEGE